MSSPVLLFFGFCFLFFTSYLLRPFRAYGAGRNFERGSGKFCIFIRFFSPLCFCPLRRLRRHGCGTLLLLRASLRPRKRQTAAPAPLRLFLPQAAPQLRSPARGGGGTALCAVTERGGSHVYGGAVMPPCGMTERAISQPLRVAPLKTPDKKEKCLLSQAFSVLWGKCSWRVKSFGQAARLTSRCGSRRGCSSASSSCRRTYPRCRTRPPSQAPAWPWRGRRSTRRCRRGGGPR